MRVKDFRLWSAVPFAELGRQRSPAAADGLEPSGTEAKRLHHVVSRFGEWYSVVDGQRAERRGPGQACSYRRAHDVGIGDLQRLRRAWKCRRPAVVKDAAGV